MVIKTIHRIHRTQCWLNNLQSSLETKGSSSLSSCSFSSSSLGPWVQPFLVPPDLHKSSSLAILFFHPSNPHPQVVSILQIWRICNRSCRCSCRKTQFQLHIQSCRRWQGQDEDLTIYHWWWQSMTVKWVMTVVVTSVWRGVIAWQLEWDAWGGSEGGSRLLHCWHLHHFIQVCFDNQVWILRKFLGSTSTSIVSKWIEN